MAIGYCGCEETGATIPMHKSILAFFKDEAGATAIEYGLIAALIAVVIIGGVTAVGTSLSASFNTVSGKLN